MACCNRSGAPKDRSMSLMDTDIKMITIPGQFWVLCRHVGLDCGTNLPYVQFLQGGYALRVAQVSRSGSWKSDLFRTLGYWSGQVSTRWILVETCPLWPYPINARACDNQTECFAALLSYPSATPISQRREAKLFIFITHYTWGQALASNPQICDSFRALSLAQHVLVCTSSIQCSSQMVRRIIWQGNQESWLNMRKSWLTWNGLELPKCFCLTSVAAVSEFANSVGLSWTEVHSFGREE